MLSLSTALAELAAHPRAVPWRLRLVPRWGAAAAAREFVVFAPPLARSAWPILARAHNACLLLNPAGMEIVSPLTGDELEPHVGHLRSIHKLPIAVAPDQVRPSPGVDVPGVDEPALAPPGAGLAVGLDIGGTSMKALAMDGARVMVTASAPTWPPGEVGIDSLARRGRELVTTVAQGRDIGSLGIGLAAPMGVGGRVLELSTILRERVGRVEAFDGFADRVAEGLVRGPVALFNDLSNLGRHLSAQGARRLVRVQIGTSFGGCWIDGDGAVVATEMGRLVADASPEATPHTYLPLRGAMRTYLSNIGVATAVAGATGQPVAPGEAGRALRQLIEARDPRAEPVVAFIADALVAAAQEFAALLVGVQAIECGGSMLQGPLGARVAEAVAARSPVPFRVSERPGEDGAIAAALAPRVSTPLRGLRRGG
ncbi:MAG: ROK family protein [Deltaproteobacteria bacterium]|nr:ROK family protein [Deltaproteobacteria bacterium]